MVGIILFIILSLLALSSGDSSGIMAILKFVIAIAMIFIFYYIVTRPHLLAMAAVIFILVLLVVFCSDE